MDTPDKDIAAGDEKPLTVRQWIATLLLIYLPPVNLIFLCYWSFGRRVGMQRKNFSKASLIMGVVNLILFAGFYFWLVWPMIMIEG